MAASTATMEIKYGKFQHTATRRWLLPQAIFRFLCLYVSTHSHPKVAAFQKCGLPRKCRGFNTQPPEGGCRFAPYVRQPFYDVSTHSHPKVAAVVRLFCVTKVFLFQHTATRRWLLMDTVCCTSVYVFQHTATRRWLLFDYLFY